MADSIGAAVFTVDADISRFDQKLTEAQGRATSAAAGINSQLQSIQGTDVVINKVGTLNLQGEIGQVEAYRGQLAALKGELTALEATQMKSRMMWQPASDIGRTTPGHMEKYAGLKEFVEDKKAIEAEISGVNQKILRAEEAMTLGITRDMMVRNSAMDQHKAKLTAFKRQQSELQSRAISEMTIGTPEGLAKYESEMRSLQRKISAMEGSKFGRVLSLEKDIAQIEVLKKELDGLKIKLATLRQSAVSNLSLSTPGGLAQFQADTQAVQSRIIALEKELATVVKSTTASIESSLSKRSLAFQLSGKKAFQSGTYLQSLGIGDIDSDTSILARAKRNREQMGAGSIVDFTKSEKELNKLGNAARNAHEPVGLLDRAFGRLSRTLFAFVGVTAFIELVTGIYQAVAAGVEFNKTIENTRLGMAALLESEGKFTQGGKILSGTEAMNAALAQSDKIIKQLQYDNLQTVATFEQLSRAYQSALAPGLAVGFNLDQVRQFTLSMVQAAAAMQLPFEQMAEEIRSLLRGSITPRNTIIATNLGITNEDIRKYKGDAQGLFDFIMGKLSEFSKYGPILQQTFTGLTSNLTDVFRMMAGEAGKGYFEYLKGVMASLTNYMADTSNAAEGIKLRPGAVQMFSDFFTVVEALTQTMLALGGAIALVTSALGAMGRSAAQPFKNLSESLDGTVAKLKWVDEYLKRINREKLIDPKMYLEDTNLGMAPSWSNTDVKSDKAQKDATISITEAIDKRSRAEARLGQIEYERARTGQVNTAAQREAVSQIYEANIVIQEYGDKMVTAGEKAHELARQTVSIGYAANDAGLSLENMIKKLHEMGGVDLSGFGRAIDDRIEGIKAKIKVLKENPLASGGVVSAMAKYAQDMSKLDRTANAAATSASLTTPAVMEQIQNREQANRAKVQQELDLTLEEKALEDKRAKLKKSSGGGGGAPKSFTPQFDKMERETRQFQKKTEDAWSEYWITVFEESGMYYEAAQMETEKWFKDQVFTITEASRKIEEERKQLQEKIDRGEASKAGNVPETQARIKQLDAEITKVKESEQPLLKAAEATKAWREQRDLLIKSKLPQMIEQENLAVAKLTGSIQEQAYWENQLAKRQLEEDLSRVKAGTPEADAYRKARTARTQIEEQRRNVLAGDSWTAGFMQAAQDAKNQLPSLGQQGADAFKMVTDAIENASDALADFCMTGEMDFSNFAQSIIREMIKIQIQSMLNKTVLGEGGLLGMLGLMGGAASSGTNIVASSTTAGNIAPTLGTAVSLIGGIMHTGGMAGSPNVSRMVPDSYFFSAPRLHNGLAADEYPAILQKGEKVIAKNQSQAEAPGLVAPIVNLVNNTGNKMDKPNVVSRYDTRQKKLVLDIVLNGMARDSDFRDSMKALSGGSR